MPALHDAPRPSRVHHPSPLNLPSTGRGPGPCHGVARRAKPGEKGRKCLAPRAVSECTQCAPRSQSSCRYFPNPSKWTTEMTKHSTDATMAVFLDLENIALGARDANYPSFDVQIVLERLLLRGHIVVKKAYCDFDRYKDFKRGLHEAAFELIEIPHVRQSGK